MKIRLVDKCLIIIMFILQAQIIYGLFTGMGDSVYTTGIDVVVRTTSAAIFGYILSANFIRRRDLADSVTTTSQPTVNAVSDSKTSNDVPTAKIGFTTDAETPTSGGVTTTETNDRAAEITASKEQIIITTAIGVVALLALLIARNFFTLDASTATTASHLRDLVSGCVGFLVGSPVSGKSDN